MRAVKTRIWSAAIKWKGKCSSSPPSKAETLAAVGCHWQQFCPAPRGTLSVPRPQETKSLIPDLGWAGKGRREKVDSAFKGRRSDTEHTQAHYKGIQIPTYLQFPSPSDPWGALLLSPNSRDCVFPQTILPWARINIHILLSIFYAHYFCTSFFMWKFKIPPSLIIHRWKPKHTRNKYPSPSQREINRFASRKKGVIALNKTNHPPSNQVINSRKLQCLIYLNLPRIMCTFKG